MLSKLKSQYESISQCKNIEQAFCVSCKIDDLQLAKALISLIPSDKYSDSFIVACSSNSVIVAKYISTLPDIDVHYKNESAFRFAAHNGYIDVLIWLKSNWPDIDHTIEDHYAFYSSLIYHHYKQVKWIVTLYTIGNIAPIINHCVVYRCEKILIYIIRYFDIDINQIVVKNHNQSKFDDYVQQYQMHKIMTKSSRKT